MGRSIMDGTPTSSQLIWCERRIEELEADNEGLRHDNARYAETTSELADENARQREALRRIYSRMDSLETFDAVVNEICESALQEGE